MARKTRRRSVLPMAPRVAGGNSPEVQANRQATFGSEITNLLAKGVKHSDIGPTGEQLQGNSSDSTIDVHFKNANTPLFIAHGLGYVVRNWTLLSPESPGFVWELPKNRPTKDGNFLLCDTVGMRCRIRFDGHKQDE